MTPQPLARSHPGELSLRQYGASHGSHTHGYFQVLVGLDGVLDLEVAGRGMRLAAGDGCLVPPGERHDFESRRGSECLVLDTRQAGWARCAIQPRRPGEALALARYLALALRRGQPQALLHGPALLLEAWGLPDAPTRPRRRIDWRALAAWAQAHTHTHAHAHVHDAASEGAALTVADLAAQVHLGVTQFAARCREETGLSPMQWLRQQRLALAQRLRADGLDVAATARRCGYRSPSALTAALRRAPRG